MQNTTLKYENYKQVAWCMHNCTGLFWKHENNCFSSHTHMIDGILYAQQACYDKLFIPLSNCKFSSEGEGEMQCQTFKPKRYGNHKYRCYKDVIKINRDYKQQEPEFKQETEYVSKKNCKFVSM